MPSLSMSTGRTEQKLRTRAALLAAARELLGEGREPNVVEVAERARVSKATAYRYFSNREALLLEAAIASEVLPFERIVPEEIDDPAARAALVQGHFLDLVRDHEARFRLHLAAALRDDDKSAGPIRDGWRVALLYKALAPLKDRLDPADLARLCTATAALSGIEAHVVMTDVCGLPPDKGREILQWAAGHLVRAVSERAA